jgi:two-component system, sensor histidine kinase LadS
MKQLLFLVWVIGCMATVGYGQVHLRVGQKELDVQEASLQYAFTDPVSFTNADVKRMLGEEWRPFTSAVKISYQPQVLWLKIPLASIYAHGSVDWLEIDNPHLDALRIWVKRADALLDSVPLTGDHHVFSSRLVPSSGFVFRTPSGETGQDTLLLAVEKRASQMLVPLSFYSEHDLMDLTQRRYLLLGAGVGMLLLFLFFNLLLFAGSGETVYAWYGLYLVSFLLYFMADNGLLFQYLFKKFTSFNDLIRPFLLAFSFISLVLFFNQLLDIKTTFPRIFRLNILVLAVFSGLCLLALIMCIYGDIYVREKWLRFGTGQGPFPMLLLLGESVYFLAKRVRFASFALVSFSSYTFLILIYSLGQNALLPEVPFVLNAHYIAFLFDSFVVSLSLIWRFYSFREDARRLHLEYLNQQKKIFAETSAWQKQKMQTMSSLLHDHLGAHLGFLRLQVDRMELSENGRKEVAGLVTALGNEVRHLSHQFSPLQLQDKGLYAAVEEMVQQTRTNGAIAMQYEWIGNRQNLDLQYELLVYRILQELFQNLLKHSQATEAILQVMHDEQQFGIYLEDNGVGRSDLSEARGGIGLKSIEQLIGLLKGRFSIATDAHKGFSISIEFPLTT